VKKTGFDPRYDEENDQALNNPGESAVSIKSTKKRSERHPPSITPLKRYLGGAKSPWLKVVIGTGTGIAEWSDAARNHPLPGENNG
jgi:hypothetical protein